jgi:hypothetical protein
LILYELVIRSMDSDHVGGVIVSVHPTCAVDRGFQMHLGQTRDYKISTCIFCFSAKLISLRRRTKTSWLRIRIMCPSGTTCLTEDGCFSGQALYIFNKGCWKNSAKQTSSSSYLII